MTEELFILGLFLLPGVVFHLYLNLLYGKSDRIAPSVLRVFALSGVGALCYLLFSRQNDVNLNAVSDVVAYFSCSFLGAFLVVHFGIFEKRYRVVQSFFFGLSENTQNKNKETVLAKIEYGGKLLDRDMGRLEKGYQSLSRKKQLCLYFLMYSLVFVVAVSIIFEPFFSNGVTLIWRTDGYPLYFTNLIYMRQYLLDLPQAIMNSDIKLFDFTIGFGDSVSRGFGSFEPYHIFLILLQEEYLEVFFSFLTLFRFYLSGIAFSLFCFYMGKSYCTTLAGSFIYSFCGHAIFAMRHPFFLTALIMLPLLLIGIEQVLRGKRETFLIGTVFFSITTSYYFFYMNTIAAGIFLLIREFISGKKIDISRTSYSILKVIRSYFIGSAMGSVIFFQSIDRYVESARTESVVTVSSWFSYGDAWIQKMILGFIAPGTQVGSWLNFMFPPIILLCVFLMLVKRKEFLQYKVALFVGVLFAYFPFLAFLATGFGNVNNRWCYIFAMIVATIYVEVSPSLLELSRKQEGCLFVGGLLYGYYVLEATTFSRIYILFAVIALLLNFITITALQKKKTGLDRVASHLLTFAVILNISIYGRIYYDEDFKNYSGSFSKIGEFFEIFGSLPATQFGNVDDETFWRGEKTYRDYRYGNEARLIGYNSTAVNNSTSSGYLLSYHQALESAGLPTLHNMSGFDSRTALETLANVKYFAATLSNTHKVPYGYYLDVQNTDFSSDVRIYQNQYALPIGYTYVKYLSEEEFMRLNPVEMQESMLEYVVLGTVDTINSDLEFNSKILDWIPIDTEGVTIEDNSVVVATEDGTLTLRFQGEANSETYVRLKGFKSESNIGVLFESSLGLKKVTTTHDSYIYSNFMDSYISNLGYSEDPLTEVTITFPETGTFPLEAIEIYCLPMDNYPEQIEELKIGALENVVIGGSSVTGTSTLEEERIMCFGIPYSAGWSATVNGEKVDIQRANIMYMAIPLEAGENEIELKYMPPGMLEGGIITILGFCVFVIGLSEKRRE